MQKFFAFLFSILLFTIYFSLFTHQALAAGEFSTAYEIIYDVSPLGKTQVFQNIRLTNLTTNYYASEFSLALGKSRVENVQAADDLGPLEVKTNFDGNITTINVKFNQKIVGKGKVLIWKLSYKAPELAQKNGQIWEVNIPKLASAEDVAEYNVILSVPAAFGPLAFISPQPKEKKEAQPGSFFQAKKTYIFDKSQLINSGVSASFGEKQIFSFQLKYHLSNSGLAPVQTEITLPQDTNYQKVSYEELEPKPLDVRADQDGNWLARYTLSAKQKLEVKARGFVEVYPRPTLKIEPKYDEKELYSYTLPQPYWDVSSIVLKEKAQELKTPAAIYNFVASYLNYNQERLGEEKVRRLGAQEAYLNPKDAVCMEFTDLFIALARAAGIPAREVNGYAYTQNERLRPLSLGYLGADVLHAWPEYYDQSQGWVQIDPTWGNTSGGLDYFSKLDFNHITFVKKGLSSGQPLPAGAYKLDPRQGGDIKIDFASTLPQERRNIKIDLRLPKKSFAGFPIQGWAKISNLGNQALPPSSLKITTEGLVILGDESFNLGILPPYATRKVDLNFQTKSFFQNEESKIVLNLDGQTQEAEIHVRPFTIFAIGIFLLILALVLAALFSIFFFIKKRKRLSSPNPLST